MQAKQIDMMSKVPDVLKDVREIKALINTENSEMNLLSAALALYLNNTFVDSADEYGIGRWESILHILPKLTDTLDERRFRVLSRINEQLPLHYVRWSNSFLPYADLRVIRLSCSTNNIYLKFEWN
ncbi:MAG: putative phage tail protein [Acutalibacteraceae bacterium]